ncbi:Com family DNA-binding transcriptional regulator [Neisseria dumasiana]
MRALRCPRCGKLLARARKGGRIEIKCPRCGHLAAFD